MNPKEHAKHKGIRAKRECRVVDNLRNFKFITRDYLVRGNKEEEGKKYTYPLCLEILW